MEFKDKKVLVVGTGISGIAAVELLNKEGADIILFDSKEPASLEELQKKLPSNFRGRVLFHEFKEEMIKGLELLVLSPGVPTDLDFVNHVREKNIPVWGEIELAYQFSKGKIVAITGTNGKTTTTTLVGELMKTFYSSVFVVGNIGIPYTSVVDKTTNESVTVAEISSFQLETIQSFRPDVSAILNITPDHLNRHHTMESYIKAKAGIAKNQGEKELCVLNYEDAILRKLAGELKTNIMWFSSARELKQGVFLRQEKIVYRSDGFEQMICNVNDLQMIGKHNYENIMAAVAMAIFVGVPVDCIRKGLLCFQGVEHRIEYVATKKGVKYYNDSKGTNPDASIQAIRAMTTKTLLIGGGYDKDSDYEEWIRAFDHKVKYLVLMGQTREKIAAAARSMGFDHIVMVESLKEAMDFCKAHAEDGESVLLSPCCASWGMFQNYEERGNMFKKYVYEMED